MAVLQLAPHPRKHGRIPPPCGRLARLSLLLAGVSLLLSSGCQNRYGKPDANAENWRQQAEQSLQNPVPMAGREPAPVIALTLPNTADEPPAPPPPPLPSNLVDELSMAEAVDLNAFLRAMARGGEVNILLGAHVSGPIRLSLSRPTPWDRLFTQVIHTHGLHYDWDGDLLRVLSQADIDRQTAVELSLRQREEAREQRRLAEPLEWSLYRVHYADTARLADSIRAGMAGPEAATQNFFVNADVDSGLIILQANSERMQRALRLARELDQPAFQILIEATIVQTNSDTARDLGFQWGLGWFNDFRLNTNPGAMTGGTGLAPGNLPGNIPGTTPPGNWNVNFPAGFNASEPGFAFGLMNEIWSKSGDRSFVLQAQLSALQKDGRLRIVSTPSITTLDKQTALIESGEERPFQSASGSGASTTPVVEFKKALLSLEVTPQVIDGQWIKLEIKTTKDDFDDSRAVIIEGTLQVPIITRSASTTLYLANGQTTVIGGLSTQAENDSESGIPWLKDIPGLGVLFRNSVNRSSFNDTLIFLTPRILPGSLPVYLPTEGNP